MISFTAFVENGEISLFFTKGMFPEISSSNIGSGESLAYGVAGEVGYIVDIELVEYL
jgi:hypothetical protein